MSRFMVIRKGIECHIGGKGKTLTLKRCRRIKTKKPISTKEILKDLGIKSY